jgi:SAM-dependent MidA family methyltransferase
VKRCAGGSRIDFPIRRLKATSAVHRLISPSEMGELFKVLAFGKGIESPLLGFQSARPMAL